MSKEPPFIPRADAERVRKAIADTGEDALTRLRAELPRFKDRLPESWVKNFKVVADQLRRDYRLEGQEPVTSGQEPAAGDVDPLAGLKVLDEDEAA
jgi:hypothetical protein